MFIVEQVEQWRRQLDKWGGGDIFIYSCSAASEINLISKKFNCAKHEYVNMSSALIDHSAGDATEVELQQTF